MGVILRPVMPDEPVERRYPTPPCELWADLESGAELPDAPDPIDVAVAEGVADAVR